MVIDSVLTCLWALTPPAILLLALNLPSLAYRSNATKVLTILLVAVAAGSVITRVKIRSPYLAFMTGLLEGWLVIWAAVLLIRYNPIEHAQRRRWSKTPQLDGEYEEAGEVWQKYPQRHAVARLLWTSDLLISFRGVGWQFDKSVKQAQKAPSGKDADGLLFALFKPVRDIIVFQVVLWIASRVETRLAQSAWRLQVLHTITWLSTSVPFINFCHSAWALVGSFGQSRSSFEWFNKREYNPSPWGPLGAIVEHGLAGLWGVTWHNYFKFGFQSATDLAISRTAPNSQLKPVWRLARMFWSFLLSGVIHSCGSYMLPGPTQPLKELLFFVLQGVAVVLQVLIYDKLFSAKFRRVFNPVLVAAWLYATESLIFGDQRHGGMWRLS